MFNIDIVGFKKNKHYTVNYHLFFFLDLNVKAEET